jgi:hypothetical protein
LQRFSTKRFKEKGEVKMKLEDLIRIYGFPRSIHSIETLRKYIEKSKKESLEIGPIEWWVLKFQNGEVYYYNSSKRDWEVLEI